MKRPFVIGLTGSIAMGKSTTAKMFADEGIPVWDADAEVRALYALGGKAVAPISRLYPASLENGSISRENLNAWITEDPKAIEQIEAIVHPLVAESREAFLQKAASDIVVLDIPLLFETGGHENVDKVVVVSTTPDVQRARALARPGMTDAQFDMILSRQTADHEKRRRAHFVIETSSMQQAHAQVRACLAEIRKRLTHA